MFETISECRVCGNAELTKVLDLGQQALTGVFPRNKTDPVPAMPLVLVKCMGDNACGLLQLEHSGDLSQMYGDNYGYRSGLNQSMVRHLHQKVAQILQRKPLSAGDVVVDIGSNDGTTLSAYPKECALYGIDPTASKFRKYYADHIHLIPEFFSARALKDVLDGRKAKVITSFSMFYDLPDPVQFMREVATCLDADGIWVSEQSYMPTMLAMNSYDTVCHEHLEYYALSQIHWMAERAGLVLADVEFNDVNGGSFSFVAMRATSRPRAAPSVARILRKEAEMGLHSLEPYQDFERRVRTHREETTTLLRDRKAQGRKVIGYGASTKGNVLLQYCGVTPAQISHIADVNEDKIGCFTPGTLIPIISEAQARALEPDDYFVLPWHFRGNILQREAAFLATGGRIIFPLPHIDVVGAA